MKYRSNHSLLNELVVFSLLAACLPVFVFGVGLGIYYQNQLLANIHQEIFNEAEHTRQESVGYLDDSVAALRVVQHLLLAPGMFSDPEIPPLLDTVVENSKRFEAIYLLDSRSRVIAAGFLADYRHLRDSFVGVDFSGHRLQVEAAAKAGPSQWSETQVSLLTGEPSALVSLPVGERLLVGSLPLDAISEAIFRGQGSESGTEIGVVDHEGNLVAHTSREKAVQRVNLNHHPDLRRVLMEKRGASGHEHEGEWQFEEIAYVPETGWAVYAQRDTELAMRPVYQLRNYLVVSLVAATLLAAGIALLLARRVRRPLSELTRFTRKISSGDYAIPPLDTRYDEINVLTGEFHAMCKSLDQRETALRLSEERYRGLINSMEGIVWELDLAEFRFTFVSPKAEEILGYPVEDWYGQENFWTAHIHPDDRDSAVRFCLDQTGLQRDHQFEYRMLHRDGRLIWIRDLVSVHVEDGAPVRLSGVMLDVTEGKRFEESLRSSERKYRSLVDTMAEGLILIDGEGRVIDCNPAAIEILGFEHRDRLIGLCLAEETLEAYHTDMRVVTVGDMPIPALLEAGTSVAGLIMGVRTRTGELAWLKINAEAIAAETGGGDYAAILTFSDISDLVMAQQSLRSSNETLSALVEAAPLAIVTSNPLGQITSWNPAAEREFGRSRLEVVGESYPDLELFQGEVGESPFEWQKSIEVVKGIELRHRRRDGSLADLRFYKAPLFGEKQDFLGMVGIFQDVTAWKSAQHQVKINEERYRLLFEEFQALLNGIPDGIMLLATDKRLIWANEVAKRMLAVPGEDDTPPRCSMFCLSQEGKCETCPIEQSLSSRLLVESLVDGREGKIFGVKALPLRNQKGTINRVIVISSDVTEKTVLREEAERAGRLASLGELSAGIAHEINNPTGLLLMNLPILREALGDALPILNDYSLEHDDFFLGGLPFSRMASQLDSLLEESINGARRIRGIVEDLKRFARSNDQQILETVDVNQAVKQSIRLVTVKINKSTDHFECRLADELPMVLANMLRVEQVIINLLLNAAQALPDKSKGMSVSTSLDARNQMVKVVVEDEGCGIRPENIKRLTDPFFTTKRDQGGTGLGLSVSSRIVRELGGRLEFRSTLGEGTTVTLSFPTAETRKADERTLSA